MKKIKNYLHIVVLVIFLAMISFPFLWQAISSFKTQVDLFSIPPTIWPSNWTLENYVDVFTRQPFLLYIKNSLVIATMSTLLCITAGSMASYSLSRTHIKGKKLFLICLLSITLLPPISIVNPVYRLMRSLELLNTYTGLILVNATMQLPMTVWFLQGFFQNIPVSLKESAEMDGANIFQIFYKIILPVVAPGIFTVSILVFIGAWNQYLFAQILNPLKIRRTITVGIMLYQTDYTIPWGTLTAASIVVTVPLILLVLTMQKRIVSGLLDGGTKE